jgi:hypothetical protein
MKRRSATAVVVLGLCVPVVLGCSPESAAPDHEASSISFIEHVDLGCKSHRDEPVWESYLVGYTVSGDTLTLTAHFWLQCMPEFEHEITIDGVDIAITVRDTSEWMARCFCNFENSFSFLWGGARELSLHFDAYQKYDTEPRCGFDTLLVVTAGDSDAE